MPLARVRRSMQVADPASRPNPGPRPAAAPALPLAVASAAALPASFLICLMAIPTWISNHFLHTGSSNVKTLYNFYEMRITKSCGGGLRERSSLTDSQCIFDVLKLIHSPRPHTVSTVISSASRIMNIYQMAALTPRQGATAYFEAC